MNKEQRRMTNDMSPATQTAGGLPEWFPEFYEEVRFLTSEEAMELLAAARLGFAVDGVASRTADLTTVPAADMTDDEYKAWLRAGHPAVGPAAIRDISPATPDDLSCTCANGDGTTPARYHAKTCPILLATTEGADGRHLHTQEADSNGVWCREDGQKWPCDTIRGADSREKYGPDGDQLPVDPHSPDWYDPRHWTALANDIRLVDGNHDLGAGELAARLTERGWHHD